MIDGNLKERFSIRLWLGKFSERDGDLSWLTDYDDNLRGGEQVQNCVIDWS